MEKYNLDRDGVVTGTGVMADATARHGGALPEWDGRHAWVVTGLWRVQNPARANHMLDMENLISIDGPGCWHCEQVWTPTMGANCPGEPVPA